MNEHKFKPNTSQTERPVEPGVLPAAREQSLGTAELCTELRSHPVAQPSWQEAELYLPHTCMFSSLERRAVSVPY